MRKKGKASQESDKEQKANKMRTQRKHVLSGITQEMRLIHSQSKEIGGREMSLINCPECGKEISDRASNCPNCGCPIYVAPIEDEEEYEDEAEGKNDTRNGVISIVLSVLGWIISLIAGDITILSLILFIISVILGVKCSKKFSIIGILISGLGIAPVVIDILLPFIIPLIAKLKN